MTSGGEFLVCGCGDSDVEVLRDTLASAGRGLRSVGSPAEMARLAVGVRPGAVVLGIGPASLDRLDLVRMVRKVWPGTPVIVVGEDDSLDLERQVRQAGVFYYVVRPLDPDEARALLEDVSRCADRAPSGPHGPHR